MSKSSKGGAYNDWKALLRIASLAWNEQEVKEEWPKALSLDELH